jgi:hypothetical protein
MKNKISFYRKNNYIIPSVYKSEKIVIEIECEQEYLDQFKKMIEKDKNFIRWIKKEVENV